MHSTVMGGMGMMHGGMMNCCGAALTAGISWLLGLLVLIGLVAAVFLFFRRRYGRARRTEWRPPGVNNKEEKMKKTKLMLAGIIMAIPLITGACQRQAEPSSNAGTSGDMSQMMDDPQHREMMVQMMMNNSEMMQMMMDHMMGNSEVMKRMMGQMMSDPKTMEQMNRYMSGHREQMTKQVETMMNNPELRRAMVEMMRGNPAMRGQMRSIIDEAEKPATK